MRNCGIRITSLTADGIAMFVNVIFNDGNKILIEILYQLTGYEATELMNEFPNKWWTKSSINKLLKKLLKKIRDACTVNRLTNSGDHEVKEKMLIWLMNWFRVETICAADSQYGP